MVFGMIKHMDCHRSGRSYSSLVPQLLGSHPAHVASSIYLSVLMKTLKTGIIWEFLQKGGGGIPPKGGILYPNTLCQSCFKLH